MTKLEDLTAGTRLTGLAASGAAVVESTQWIGQQAIKVIFRDSTGQLDERLLYRDDEPSLELVEMGRPWSFDGDGDLLRDVLFPERSGSQSTQKLYIHMHAGDYCRFTFSLRD